MLSKKNTVAQLDAPNTVIGSGALLEAARLSGNESVRIDGEFRGNIDINGSLVLGDSGSVTGDIAAKYIVVAGTINGNISCESMLHFASTARIVGDIQTQSLIVDEGCQISGRYLVGEPAQNGRRPALETAARYYDDTSATRSDTYDSEEFDA